MKSWFQQITKLEGLNGDFAYKVHSVLEGRGENSSEFEGIENLTEKVGDFYNSLSKYAGSTGMSPRFIEVNFETYFENDGEYSIETHIKAVEKLIREPRRSVLAPEEDF